jgi:hypothetical protein
MISFDWKSYMADRAIFVIWRRLLEQFLIKQFSSAFFTCLLVGWPMRSLTRSIAIFHKTASSASLEATTAIIAITARSAVVMFSTTFFTCLLACLLVGWPMRNLTRSIAIFHKIACSASLESTAANIAITARSTVMFDVVCIFRGDGAHDLLL